MSARISSFSSIFLTRRPIFSVEVVTGGRSPEAHHPCGPDLLGITLHQSTGVEIIGHHLAPLLDDGLRERLSFNLDGCPVTARHVGRRRQMQKEMEMKRVNGGKKLVFGTPAVVRPGSMCYI